jgi:uncharacterized protein YutE (UPF0331/DUF86 family)
MVRHERRQALRDALEDLERYRTTFPIAIFLTSRDAQRLILHSLYVAVQACVDEALEACKRRDLEVRGTYRDAFLTLGANGSLDAELASRLADWASFRNVLAHLYPVIDLRRVYGALDDIEDLAEFERWLIAGETPGCAVDGEP